MFQFDGIGLKRPVLSTAHYFGRSIHGRFQQLTFLVSMHDPIIPPSYSRKKQDSSLVVFEKENPENPYYLFRCRKRMNVHSHGFFRKENCTTIIK